MGLGAADRVAEHQQPRGEPLHLVVSSPRAARITKDGHLAALQRPQQRRRRELRGQPNHARQIIGRFILRQAGDGEYPLVTLVHRKRSTRWLFGSGTTKVIFSLMIPVEIRINKLV
jgi:hypothetical protein